MTLDLFSARARLYRYAFPSQGYLDFIRNNGLANKSLAGPDPIADHCGCLAVTAVKTDWNGGFEFAGTEDTKTITAAVFECIGRDGETPVDIVAFDIANPERVRTMFGRAAMLGSVNVYSAASYTFGTPLQIYRTPLAWLRAGCKGAVVLDASAAARCLLDATEMGNIAGEDRQHSAELAQIVASLFDRTRFVAPVQNKRKAAA